MGILTHHRSMRVSHLNTYISVTAHWLHHFTDRNRLTLSFFNSPSISISKVGYIALYWLANTLNLEDKSHRGFIFFFPSLTSTDPMVYWSHFHNYFVKSFLSRMGYKKNISLLQLFTQRHTRKLKVMVETCIKIQKLPLRKFIKIRHKITHSESTSSCFRRIYWTNSFLGSSQTLKR